MSVSSASRFSSSTRKRRSAAIVRPGVPSGWRTPSTVAALPSTSMTWVSTRSWMASSAAAGRNPAAAPAHAADKCADQLTQTRAAADGEADATRKAKAVKILNDAEADLKDGNEAFCLDEVAAARKTLGLK